MPSQSPVFYKKPAFILSAGILSIIAIAIAAYVIISGRDTKSSGGAQEAPVIPLVWCVNSPAYCKPANVPLFPPFRDAIQTPPGMSEQLQALKDKYPEYLFPNEFNTGEFVNVFKSGLQPFSAQFLKEFVQIYANSGVLQSNENLDKRLYLKVSYTENFDGDPGYNLEAFLNPEPMDTRVFSRLREDLREAVEDRWIIPSRVFENGCPAGDYCEGAIEGE